MNVTFYIEIQNGEKFQWVNHLVTKETEIEWLLGTVEKKLRDALKEKNNVVSSNILPEIRHHNKDVDFKGKNRFSKDD